MTSVMPMINNPKTTSIIIDLRFNMGGDDEIGHKVLSYFISEKREIYSRKTFYAASKWTIEKNILISPSEQKNTTTPIKLLIGPITASAAETFALGMKSLPQVKIVGENSMGIFSDQFPRKLPNGWWVTLSNELVLSPDKLSYEGIGVPVNYHAAFPFLSTLGNNIFPGIDAAVQSTP
jgi:carboxyl-terminal processing protease